MTYFKINNVDFSTYVSSLQIANSAKYTAETNAAGDTVVDIINKKRTVTVGIIPLNNVDIIPLLSEIDKFGVSISFRNPLTNELEENVNCIIPKNNIDYYTIQSNKVSYKAFTLTFNEL